MGGGDTDIYGSRSNTAVWAARGQDERSVQALDSLTLNSANARAADRWERGDGPTVVVTRGSA